MDSSSEDKSKNKDDRSPTEFLHYFGKDRIIQFWLREKRTHIFAFLFPRFQWLGLVPDSVSYIGIALLAGVVLYFVRDPLVASLFLLGHIVCDGLDGAFARHSGLASQSGAFTDLVCDQLGMIVVGLMAIFHHMVSPLLGTVYIALYLIVVVFGVIINVMGLKTRITITSKYFMYGVYGLWAGWEVNLFPWLLSFFSVVMALEVIVGYVRLKRGLRKRFDSAIDFTYGSVLTGGIHRAVNIFLPILVLLAILIGANVIPIHAIFAQPTEKISWEEGPVIVPPDDTTEILGLSVHDNRIVVMVRQEDGGIEVRRFLDLQRAAFESFTIPDYVNPSFSSFPVADNTLFVADKSTRLLLGMDMEASFATRKAVIVLTLPLGYLRITAMNLVDWGQKKMWLVANYLYTRKTYVVDPEKALKKGYILGGVVASYTNGAFPAGLTAVGCTIFELNKAPFNPLIYQVSLKKMVDGKNLIEASKLRFPPPCPDAMGPVQCNGYLLMLSPAGRVYRTPVQKSLLHDGGKDMISLDVTSQEYA